MQNDYNIAITTFSLRFGMVKNLIKQIRSFTDRKIILCINGEKDGDFNEVYRKELMVLCYESANVFPIFFVETRGLSKMWNTALSHSDKHFVMMLNDDILIQSGDVFEKVFQHINTEEFNGLSLINSSFSHYIADRRLIDELGYFDERLLGFGEEDSDIIYRLLKNKGMNNGMVWVGGLINIISQIRDENVKKGSINNVEHKYSDQNRSFIYGMKYKTNHDSQYKGWFDTPMDQHLEDEKIYPYERFFWENKKNLFL